MTFSNKIVPANLVPAAAVIRGERALYNQTGRKGFYGGKLQVSNTIFKNALNILLKLIFLNKIRMCFSASRELKCIDGCPRAKAKATYYILLTLRDKSTGSDRD